MSFCVIKCLVSTVHKAFDPETAGLAPVDPQDLKQE